MKIFQRRRELNVHWRQCNFLVIDLETTGLNLASDSIISYGAVPVTAGRVISSEGVYGLVHPDRPLSPASIQVHTLREADLRDAPPLSTAMENVSHLLSGRILVAHAAWVEDAFLRRGFEHIGRNSMPPMIDTAALARAAGIIPRNSEGEPDLEWLCTRLSLPVMDPHHALGDAMTTAGLFIALASKLDASGEHTARALLELSECNSTRRPLPFFR